MSSVHAFRAISSSFRHSEPLSSVLSIQSHVFSLVFRAMSLVWHLEPSSSSVWRSELCLYFGIQIHCPSWHSVPPSSFSFGVQSRCAYSFRHLESPSSFIFGIQSCCAYSFCHLESPSLFSFDIQSHYAYSFRHFESLPFLLLEFKVIFFLSLFIQSHSS